MSKDLPQFNISWRKLNTCVNIYQHIQMYVKHNGIKKKINKCMKFLGLFNMRKLYNFI